MAMVSGESLNFPPSYTWDHWKQDDDFFSPEAMLIVEAPINGIRSQFQGFSYLKNTHDKTRRPQ